MDEWYLPPQPPTPEILCNSLELKYFALVGHFFVFGIFWKPLKFFGIEEFSFGRLIFRFRKIVWTSLQFFGIQVFCFGRSLIRFWNLLEFFGI